jgi:hypothetical protein
MKEKTRLSPPPNTTSVCSVVGQVAKKYFKMELVKTINIILKLTLVLFVTCFMLMPVSAAQVAGKTPQTADGIYRQALDAYLDGHFDESIALVAKSLTLDSNHAKSKNLLSILVFEKERERKSVIWLAGKPVYVTPVPVPGPAPIPMPVFPKGLDKKIKLLQMQLNQYFNSQAARDAQREGQIDVIQALLKNNEGSQYGELKQALDKIYDQLKAIQAEGSPDLRLLYLICGLSLFFSFLALWKASKNKQ